MKNKNLTLLTLAGLIAIPLSRASAQNGSVTVIVPDAASVQITTPAATVPPMGTSPTIIYSTSTVPTEPVLVTSVPVPVTPVPAGAGAVVDAFDVNTWVAATAEGANLALSLVPGAVGQALKLDYDLRGPGGWVQIARDANLPAAGNNNLQFQYRVNGNRSDFLEINLLGDDGAAYSHKFPLGDSPNWQTKTISLDQFNAPGRFGQRVNNVRRVEMRITGDEGSRKSVEIDELRLVP